MTGAPTANRIPVTLGEVDTMRFGAEASGASAAAGTPARGTNVKQTRANTAAPAASPASLSLFIWIQRGQEGTPGESPAATPHAPSIDVATPEQFRIVECIPHL
ncbi:hypothetical protein [Burkholderia sp. IDO3]|uniref:hypothetical protein n=1 Tax=Burkholderia sp. IDO3 TaxID=1705310 RepID=UPI001F07B1EC|nr:hypothetical protein [Burkholderia sp. IDO3]